jgi:hypothetical protein
MTTPTIIETVRNGNTIGKPNLSGQAAPATPPSDRVW